MKRIAFLCFTVMLLLPLIVSAQEKSSLPYYNAVKLNSAGLFFHNISTIYERNLNDHWSVLMGAGYRWGGGIPKVLGLGDLIITSKTKGLRGFSMTPEVRYYFDFCDCGEVPMGLYAGLYGRMTKFYGDLKFHYWIEEEYVDVVGATNFRELGVGIQLGYQMVFKGRYTLDIMFAGPRISTNRLRLSVNSDYAEELIPILEEEINKRLEWLGIDPITISPSAEVETRFGFKNFRYAIGIGILF